MKSRIRAAILLAFAVSSTSIGTGCGNSTNDEGVNATKGIAEANAPKTQEEYFRQQLDKKAAEKKAARPGR